MGVAFLRSRHLKHRNATPFSDEKHYICDMKEMIETMPRIELALIIIGVFVLVLCIIFGLPIPISMQVLFLFGVHHAQSPLHPHR